jgi:hypothetical protein
MLATRSHRTATAGAQHGKRDAAQTLQLVANAPPLAAIAAGIQLLGAAGFQLLGAARIHSPAAGGHALAAYCRAVSSAVCMLLGHQAFLRTALTRQQNVTDQKRSLLILRRRPTGLDDDFALTFEE